MATRKAVILARGLGTRMQMDAGAPVSGDAARLAAAGLKGLIPIAGRPFLDYLFGAVADAGFGEVCLVVGPQSDDLRRYGEALAKRSSLAVYFAVQKEPKGTADALAAAEGFAEGEPVVMLNSDNWMSADGLRALREARGAYEGEEADDDDSVPGLPAMGGSMEMRDTGYEEEFGGSPGDSTADDTAFGVAMEAGVQAGFVIGFERGGLLRGNIPAERISRFGVLDTAFDARLLHVVEKPADPDKYAREGKLYLSMNCWQMPPVIFDACRAITPSPRGEYEVTDAVQWLIDNRRAEFRVLYRSEPVLDLTSRGDIAQIERALAGVRLPFPPPK